MTARRAGFTLFLVAALAVGCATSAPREAAPAGGGPSVVSPEDREMVDRMNEGIGIQGRQLFAAQAEAAPDCARVCQLVGNICALSAKICGIASRYPAGDPVAHDCVDSRARCQHAREASVNCACRVNL